MVFVWILAARMATRWSREICQLQIAKPNEVDGCNCQIPELERSHPGRQIISSVVKKQIVKNTRKSLSFGDDSKVARLQHSTPSYTRTPPPNAMVVHGLGPHMTRNLLKYDSTCNLGAVCNPRDEG